MTAPPETLWICHSGQDDARCDELRQVLKAAGYEVGCAHQLAPGSDAQREVARGLRASGQVLVLACAELLAHPDWSAAEGALRERAASVTVVRLRAHLHEWAGFRQVSASESGLAARVLLRLRGAQAPERTRYREGLRRQHEKVSLWRLRRDEAQGIRDAALQRLYVPPHLQALVAEGPPQRCAAGALLTREERRLLVRGEPGLGKSTLLRHLLLQALEQPALLPVWLRAASTAEAADLEAHLRAELEQQDPEAGRWLLEDALADGAVLLLVDGLDEAAQHQQQRLVRALCILGERWSGVRVVMTSRPQAQVQVPGALTLDLQGLEPDQAALLWTRLGEVEGQEGLGFVERWEGWGPQLRDLARIPLLLILLRQIERDQALRSRVQVYCEALDLLLERWGGWRDQQAEAPVRGLALRQALERIALRMQEEEKESLPRSRLERLLREALGPQEGARALREAIEVGLLQPAEPGALAFLHATFREYLAALALLRDQASWQAHLPRLRNEARWREVLYLAVAQLGVVEEDGASADQRLREVLAGEPQTMGEVLFGPLCLVGELLAEGVGASRALHAEVLERLRAVWWYPIGQIPAILVRLVKKPGLPLSPAWLEALREARVPRRRIGVEKIIFEQIEAQVTASLVPHSEEARRTCEAWLAPPPKDKRADAFVLAGALGLARGGVLLDEVLAGLSGVIRDGQGGWRALSPWFLNSADSIWEGLAEDQEWARQVMAGLLRHLEHADRLPRLGAAWLLAALGRGDKAVLEVLLQGGGDNSLDSELQSRCSTRLRALLDADAAVTTEVVRCWRERGAGPGLPLEWVTPLLRDVPRCTTAVREELLAQVVSEDEARGAWALKQIEDGWRDALGEVVQRLTQRSASGSVSAQRRLMEVLRHGRFAPLAWEDALRSILAASCVPEVRSEAAMMAAKHGCCAALAIPELVAGLAQSRWDAVHGLGDFMNEPAMKDQIIAQVRRALTELPVRGRYNAASFLWQWGAMPAREVASHGFAALAESAGQERLQLLQGLAAVVDKERLALAVVPLLLSDERFEAIHLLSQLRPESAAVLHAILDTLSTNAADGQAVQMVSHRLGFLPWDSIREQTLGAAPRRAWTLLQMITWDDPGIREVLYRLLDAPELAPQQGEIARRLWSKFHDAAPLASLLRVRLARGGLRARVEAATRLLDLKQSLREEELALLGPLLAESVDLGLRLRGAVLVLQHAASPHLLELASAALLDCLHEPATEDDRTGAWCIYWRERMKAVGLEDPFFSGRAWAALFLFERASQHSTLGASLLAWLTPGCAHDDLQVAVALLQRLPFDQARATAQIQTLLSAKDDTCRSAGLWVGAALGVALPVLLPAAIVTVVLHPHRWSERDHDELLMNRTPAEQQQVAFLWSWRTHCAHRHTSAITPPIEELLPDPADRATLAGSFQEALTLLQPASREQRRDIAVARLFLGEAATEDYEFLSSADCRFEWHRIVEQSKADPGLIRHLAARAVAKELSAGPNSPQSALVQAEKAFPGSARAHLIDLLEGWLRDDEPSFRLEALLTLEDLGWLEPRHGEVARSLVLVPFGSYAFHQGDGIRIEAGAVIEQHFPVHLPIVVEPFLELFHAGYLQGKWAFKLWTTTLHAAGYPRVALTALLREWLGESNEEKRLCHPVEVRDILAERGLLVDLEDACADWALRALEEFAPLYLQSALHRSEIEEEPAPDGASKFQGWLKAVPDLLCSALARRLELPMEIVHALWREVALPAEPSPQTRLAMAQVLRCAADQVALRPFTAALVQRWERTRRAQTSAGQRRQERRGRADGAADPV